MIVFPSLKKTQARFDSDLTNAIMYSINILTYKVNRQYEEKAGEKMLRIRQYSENKKAMCMRSRMCMRCFARSGVFLPCRVQ